MKITMYELLGMLKDGIAPKKIKYDNCIFKYDGIYYMTEDDTTYLDEYCDLSRVLNEEVEILEEKKIPEKLTTEYLAKSSQRVQDDILDKINEIIDYLDYLKSKGDE